MITPFSRILLIDDMPSIHEDFRKVLTPSRGSASLDEAEGVLFGAASAPRAAFELDCASGGEEGLRLLRASSCATRAAVSTVRVPATSSKRSNVFTTQGNSRVAG